MYVLEMPLHADFAIVRAYKADRWGNCVFRKTARNFSPMMCMAGKVTIVEAEHIVDVGELPPDAIHVPGVFVQRVVALTPLLKYIEDNHVPHLFFVNKIDSTEVRVRDMLAARAEAPLACGRLAGCTQRSRHFRVTAVAGVGDVRRAVEATLWIAGREPEIVGWRRLVPPDDAG